MPLLSPPRTLIETPVTDKVFGDTIIKQKAIFSTLTHVQLGTGECLATVNVLVRSYASVGGDFGDSLHTKGVPDRFVAMTADNNCVVDAQTGAVLAIRGEETNKEWQDILDAFPGPVMLQGDFFEALRENPVKIGDLIRLHITQADALGRFHL